MQPFSNFVICCGTILQNNERLLQEEQLPMSYLNIQPLGYFGMGLSQLSCLKCSDLDKKACLACAVRVATRLQLVAPSVMV